LYHSASFSRIPSGEQENVTHTPPLVSNTPKHNADIKPNFTSIKFQTLANQTDWKSAKWVAVWKLRYSDARSLKIDPDLGRDLMEAGQHRKKASDDRLFFRGARTGNRSYVATDQEFMTSPEVDIRFSDWTGDPSERFFSLPEHCDYK
jgi:hypothetical protein